MCLILGSGDSGAWCFFSWPSDFPSVPFILWLICPTSTLHTSVYQPLPNIFHSKSVPQSHLVISSFDHPLPSWSSWGHKEHKSKHLSWKKVIKYKLDAFATPMSFRDPKTWWILSLLPQGVYTVSIKLPIRAKKVINVSSTNIFGDTSTLILSRETQLAASTRNTFPIKKKKCKVPKGKSQMTNAPLSLDWMTSPVVPHWQLSSGRAQYGAEQ